MKNNGAMYILLSLLVSIFFSFSDANAAGSYCEKAFANKDSTNDKMLIDLYTKCLAEGLGCNVQYATAYNNRGGCYYNIGMYNEALADLNKSISLNPKYKTPYKNRARVYRKLGKMTEAAADETTYNKLK